MLQAMKLLKPHRTSVEGPEDDFRHVLSKLTETERICQEEEGAFRDLQEPRRLKAVTAAERCKNMNDDAVVLHIKYKSELT